MKYYRFPENKITKTCFACFLFVMLCLTRTSMHASHLLGINKVQFIQLGLMCVLGIAFLTVNRKNLKEIFLDTRMLAILCTAVIMLLPMFVKRDWQMMYFSILLCAFFAIFVTYFISYKEAAKYYVVILSFLAVYSLITLFILRPLALEGILSVPKMNYMEWYDYYYFGLSFIVDLPNYIRNYGVFREPGIYQFFIMVALYLNTFVTAWRNEKIRWTINALFAVTMVTTFSTNGVFQLCLYVLVLFFDMKLYKDKLWRIIAAVCIVLGVIGLICILTQGGTLYVMLTEMVKKLFTESRSTKARMESLVVNLSLFFQSPVFGDKIATVLHAVEHNTASTLILYAIYGVVGGTWNVLAWVALVWEKNRKLWANLAYVVIMLMSFNTQNLTADVFFWLFPMMALVERGLPLLERKKHSNS